MNMKDIERQKQALMESAREEAMKFFCPKCGCCMADCGSAVLKAKNNHGKEEAISGDYCQCCYLHWMSENVPKFVKKTILS